MLKRRMPLAKARVWYLVPVSNLVHSSMMLPEPREKGVIRGPRAISWNRFVVLIRAECIPRPRTGRMWRAQFPSPHRLAHV